MEVRKELRKLTGSLDAERRLNTTLRDQSKDLQADISVWFNQPFLRPIQADKYATQSYDVVCLIF